MKKTLSLLVVIVFAANGPVKAQLFQKLKDKVTNKLGGNNQQTSTAAGTNSAAQPFTDFAKYNITTSIAIPQNGVSGKTHTFNAAHSVYRMTPGGPVVDAVVYATDRNMGEAEIFQSGDQAYIYENGKLTAQKTIGEIEGDQSLNMDENRFDYPQSYSGAMSEFYPDGNPAHFTFGGKSYTSYMMVFKSIINKDKSKFYAIGAENGNDGLTYYLFWPGGRIKLPGIASNIMLNADFSAAGAYGFSGQMNTDDNQSSAAILQSANNVLSHSDVYFANGTVITKGGMTYNAWLDPTGKNILAADDQSGNYINGKQISTEGAQPGDLWCGADGSRWAYFKNTGSGQPGHLKFYDGADVPNALNPRQMNANGKSYVVWLQYKDLYSGDLLFCTREL